MAMPNDTRPIHKIELEQGQHEVGLWGVTRISAIDEDGNFSRWFDVWKGEALFCRVNCQYVTAIYYVEGLREQF